MTTFTLQDLTNNTLPTTPEEDEAMKELFEKMGQDLANHELAHQQAQQSRLDAVPPQPTTQVSPEALIEHMVAQFSTNLKLLLTTIISQPKAQPDVGTNVPSLQETIELTLQQADWFKTMVRETIVDEVSLDDQLDDVVRERLDEVVQEQLEEVVAEKLKNLRVVFD
jgi:hypothetical protein